MAGAQHAGSQNCECFFLSYLFVCFSRRPTVTPSSDVITPDNPISKLCHLRSKQKNSRLYSHGISSGTTERIMPLVLHSVDALLEVTDSGGLMPRRLLRQKNPACQYEVNIHNDVFYPAEPSCSLIETGHHHFIKQQSSHRRFPSSREERLHQTISGLVFVCLEGKRYSHIPSL